MKPSPQMLVTPEAPWLGLRAFTEELRPYFFGRERELDDLFERVAQKPLTVLFGQSGLGKTSLVQAALMPRLQSAGFARVLLRLDHGEQAPPLEQQVLAALRAGLDAATPPPNDALPAPLWRWLHDPAFGLCREGAPRLVLMLDQFEEIFTLGENTPKRRDASRAFLNVLADLVENRVPASLRPLIEEDDDFADRLDYAARPLKILISLREDFLHRLERWRAQMPSLMDNRFELRLLTGPQALQAVVEPGKIRCKSQPALPPIVSEATGAAIVRFVADVEHDVPLAEIDAVPPLLSLLCAELNAQRGDSPTIRSEQIEGRAEDILGQFYERCFAPHPPEVRRFVEDRLLSPEGFRQNANVDTFLHDMEHGGLTEAQARTVLAQLVDARLIVSEERGGIHRIELTHDTLTGVARTSRDQRIEREEKLRAERELEVFTRQNRRRRMVTAAMAVLTVAAGVGFWWALDQRGALQESDRQQRHILADSDYTAATHWLRMNETAGLSAEQKLKNDQQTMASLGRALTWEPAHPKAAVLTAFLMEKRPVQQQIQPLGIHRLPAAEAGTLEIDASRRWALSHDGKQLILRNAESWQETGRSAVLGKVEWAHWHEGQIGVFTAEGKFHVFRVDAKGALSAPEPHTIGPGVRRVVWTPDGKPALAILRDARDADAIGDDRTEAELLRFFTSGSRHVETIRSAGKVGEAQVTKDGQRALVAVRGASDGHDEMRVYSAEGGPPLWQLECENADAVKSVVRADGHALMQMDDFLRRLDLATLQEQSHHTSYAGDDTCFSPDGLWALVKYKLLLFPPDAQKTKGAQENLKPGPLGSFIIAKTPFSHSAEFTRDSRALALTLGDDKPEDGLFIYALDVDEALLGLLDTPLEEKRGYAKCSLFAYGKSGFAVQKTVENVEQTVLFSPPESETDTWGGRNIPFIMGGEWSEFRLGESVGVTAMAGSQAWAWHSNDEQKVQTLRESAEIKAVWAADQHWLTATADHVALWPVQVAQPELDQALGFARDKDVKVPADYHLKAVRQLADGRWLCRRYSRYADDGGWALTDARRELITFVTDDIPSENLPSQATCSADGSRLFVSDAKGELREWDTTRSGVSQIVTPPAAGAALIALYVPRPHEPSEPRALYLRADGRCLDADLTGKRAPLLLSALPRPDFVKQGATALPGDQGWLVGGLDAARKHRVFRIDAVSAEALPLSADHPDTERPGRLSMIFALSPSGRYWAAVAAENYNSGNRWFWCYDTHTGKTLFDASMPIEVDLRQPMHLRFDATESFVGCDDAENAFTFDLGRENGKPGFTATHHALALAEQATIASTPAWLPPLLAHIAEPAPDELLTGAEMAEKLGLGMAGADVFSRIASRWFPVEQPAAKAPAHASLDEANQWLEKFGSAENYDKTDEVREALWKLVPLYRELSSRAALSTYHQVRYGEVLMRTAHYEEAASVLSTAALSFPFHVKRESSQTLGKKLHSHLAYALWMSGRKKDAVRYAQDQRFHEGLWLSSQPPLRIHHQDRTEEIDCDAALRAATPQPAAAASTPSASITPMDTRGRSASKMARDRAWAALRSSSSSSDPAQRRASLEEAAVRFSEAVSQAQIGAEAAAKPGNYNYVAQSSEPDRLVNQVYDRVNYARVLRALGRESEAQATLVEAEAVLPQMPKPVQAWLRQTQGRKEESLRLWSQVVNGYQVEWRWAADAVYAARQWGQLLRAIEFLQVPTGGQISQRQRFVGTLRGWLEWELGNEDAALKAWQDAESYNFATEKDPKEENPMPHDYTRADWLPGMAAVLSTRYPDAALACWRLCLQERPELALPGALEAEDYAARLWSWINHRLEPVRQLRHQNELKKRLRQLHTALPADERMAAEAAGLLATHHPEDAARLLSTAAARFPDSPWIALQQAAFATRARDDARALDAWQRALAGLALDAEERASAAEAAELSGAGRPGISGFLQLAQRTRGGADGQKLATLLPMAREFLDSGSDTALPDGWLLLAALDEDPQERCAESFESAIEKFQEQHPRGAILERDAAFEKQLYAGLILARTLHGQPKLAPLEACSALYPWLGLPGEGLSKWEEQMKEWKAPPFVLKRLQFLPEQARKEPVSSAIGSKPDELAMTDWLRSLGHEDAAQEQELQSEQDVDKRAVLLLKRGRDVDYDEVIRTLRPIMDERDWSVGSGVQRRLNIARAQLGLGKHEDAYKLLFELFTTPQLRRDLGRDAVPDEALALISELAVVLDKTEEALKLIVEVERLVPESEAFRLRAAWLALAQERYEDAVRLFSRCESKENRPARFIGSAIAYWRQGRKPEAVQAYFENVWDSSANAVADYRPAGVPDGYLPELAELRAALTAETFEPLFRGKNYDTPAEYVWKADALWNLGWQQAAISAARIAIQKADPQNAAARANACYTLAWYLSRQKPRKEEALREAEQMADEAARLQPDHVGHLLEWVRLLGLTKQPGPISEACLRGLGFEKLSAGQGLQLLQAVLEAGGLPLLKTAFEAAPPHRQKELRAPWIELHIDAREPQQALDLLTQHEADIKPEVAAAIRTYAQAGLGQMDAALREYLDLLGLDADEPDNDLRGEDGEWKLLHQKVRDAFIQMPDESIIEQARHLAATDRTQLVLFVTALEKMKHGAAALTAQELLLPGQDDNRSGTALSIELARLCLVTETPPNHTRALHYLSHPQWTLKDGRTEKPTFVLDDKNASSLDTVTFIALQLGQAEIVRRCVEIEKTALLSSKECSIEDYALEHIGNPKGADECHALNLQRFGHTPTVLLSRALVLFNRGDADAAETLFQKIRMARQATNVALNSSEWRMHAAFIAKLGRQAEAIEALRQSIRLEPESGGADYYTGQNTLDGAFWPPSERDVLEPLRAATIAKYPELVAKTTKP